MGYSQVIDAGAKILSMGVIPALLWVNSVSVDMALVGAKLEASKGRIERLESSLSKLTTEVSNNSGELREIKATLTLIHELVREIRADLRNASGTRGR